jgi:succinylglutamate desuccinylase
MVNRIVGTLGGDLPGPLVVVTAALHGNEPAGVRALEVVFDLLRPEKYRHFKGRFIGLIGNVQAYSNCRRFVDRDFNRVWLMDQLAARLTQGEAQLHGEDLELVQLYNTICTAVEASKPERILLLDLHTTSAGGGVFSIPTDEGESLTWAKKLQVPVVLGLYEKVEGTLLRFGSAGFFAPNRMVITTLGVAYEAGQHDEPASVTRSIAAILNTLHHAGCLPEGGNEWSAAITQQHIPATLPLVTRLMGAHHIKLGDDFVMRPGYVNFQRVQAGEHLADDVNGPILAPYNSLILMPLYQTQGSDGFFLVRAEVE